MAHENLNIILSGIGGQGILRAGQILCNAVMSQGYNIYCFEEHGMAQRGGSVASYIRFGEDIYTPFMLEGTADLLVAFEPVEALRPLRFMSHKGMAIINTRPIIPVTVSSNKELEYPDLEKIVNILNEKLDRVVSLDATDLAEKAGNTIGMNSVMIGAMCASGMMKVPKVAVLDAIKSRIPLKALEVNQKAFDLGFEAIEGDK